MYGPSGRLYVYRIHGHHCANIVTGVDGEASAVLLRAGEVIDGVDLARRRRPAATRDADLARGPGRLAGALGITMDDLDTDVFDGTPICLLTQEPLPPNDISAGPRVGVRRAADRPWRFWITDDPTVSVFRRHSRADQEH